MMKRWQSLLISITLMVLCVWQFLAQPQFPLRIVDVILFVCGLADTIYVCLAKGKKQ